jgi:hypothetical protein
LACRRSISYSTFRSASRIGVVEQVVAVVGVHQADQAPK